MSVPDEDCVCVLFSSVHCYVQSVELVRACAHVLSVCYFRRANQHLLLCCWGGSMVDLCSCQGFVYRADRPFEMRRVRDAYESACAVPAAECSQY